MAFAIVSIQCRTGMRNGWAGGWLRMVCDPLHACAPPKGRFGEIFCKIEQSCHSIGSMSSSVCGLVAPPIFFFSISTRCSLNHRALF